MTQLINNCLSNDGRNVVDNAVPCHFNPFLLKVTILHVPKTLEKDFWCVRRIQKFKTERKLT